MTIGRRHALGLGTLGVGAIALDACGGGMPWGQTAGPAPADVERLLRELDIVVARLQSLETDPTRFGIKRENATADGEAAVKQLLTSMCFLGTYRDVPAAMWEEPSVEARLAKTLPTIGATIERARARVEGLSEEDCARIDEKLQKNPDITMHIMGRVDEYAKQVHVPFEQRTYMRTASAQLAGRFRYEGSKEVTAKLTKMYARTLASRKSELGMDGENDALGGGGDQKTQPTPLRVEFHTRASNAEIRAVTCGLEPKVSVGGTERPIVVDWEEFRCPVNTSTKLDDHPIRATVHVEPAQGGESLVTIVLYAPPDATDDLSAAITALGREMQQRLLTREEGARAHFAGRACVATADCGPLHCVSERCVDPSGRPTAIPQARLGVPDESCRTKADCNNGLVCKQAVCKEETSSSKLMRTTGKVAKWGLIFLIPPLCAVGVLILLACLVMVIVAGFESASGD